MNKIKEKINKIDLKYVHIAIIILGIIFIFLSVFHNNMWFDESYSVGIARHSFAEIWKISAHDVHPIFYYYCLHILYLIFGSNVMVYRLFSAVCIALLGIIGYTHIRKDFGEKTGLLFSFLTLFLPVSAQFAGEIRMYALGMLLGTIMAIYAYRIYQGKATRAGYIFFGLSSILVAYTHYYGLMIAGIINLLLLIYLIKNRKERKQDLIIFLIIAVIQVVLYLPWLISFLSNLKGTGFWITLTFPGTIYDILTIQYAGNLSFQPIILSTAFYAYIVYLIFKTNKDERKPADWCFIIYISVIIIALIISACLHSVILLNRYLLVVTGLLIFGISFFMAKDIKKWRVITVCVTILILSTASNIITIKENYNKTNRNFMSYLDENIEADDIIVYSNAINGEVITTEVSQNHENISYFYNKEKWGVQEAYKAFGPYMEIKDTLPEILDNYTGRIWLVESGNTHELLDEISDKYQITKIEDKQFKNKYKNYEYTIELIEKNDTIHSNVD